MCAGPTGRRDVDRQLRVHLGSRCRFRAVASRQLCVRSASNRDPQTHSHLLLTNNLPSSFSRFENRSHLVSTITIMLIVVNVVVAGDPQAPPNQWIAFFTSTENRHALPLFTSLLNIVCAYDPVGYGVPYNHLMFNDAREPLVEIALQVRPSHFCNKFQQS